MLNKIVWAYFYGIQIHFPHMEKKKPLSLWCYDLASGCRYELLLSGDKVYKWQSEFQKNNNFWLWLKADSLMWTGATSEREQWTLLKTASLHFHFYPPERPICTRIVPAVKPSRIFVANLSLLNCLFDKFLISLFWLGKQNSSSKFSFAQ